MFVPKGSEAGSILLCLPPTPSLLLPLPTPTPTLTLASMPLRVSWSQVALSSFYFRVKAFLICLKMYCKSNWAILSGNHMAASWGYGKVGKGGRHLIPLKWANKMSYPQTSREKRVQDCSAWGRLQCGIDTRASCSVKEMSSSQMFLLE